MKTLSGSDIVIAGATRSIIGSVSKTLKEYSALELAAPVLNALLAHLEQSSHRFRREMAQQWIIGLGVGSGTGQNLPRQVARKCGIDTLESAFLVNELCVSSLEAVLLGIQSLRLGEYPLVVAGGVESMSRAPYLITARQLLEWEKMTVEEIQPLVDKADNHDALWCMMHNVHTIVHAENTTARWVRARGLDPEEFKNRIDEYAILSNERACRAIAAGAFREEIAVIPGTAADDELPRVRKRAKLEKRRGTHYTPDGIFLSNLNSPPPANAAAFLIMTTRAEAARLGLEPLARVTGFGRAGVRPEEYLLAPVAAVKNLCQSTDTKIGDYDLLEMNSAFGSQMLINQAELDLEMERVNIYGDCIALGHPVGAAGARLLTTLVYGLKHEDLKTGLTAICVGGGNALALAIAREEQ